MSDPLAVAEKVAKALSMDNRKSIPMRKLVMIVSSSCDVVLEAPSSELLSPIHSKDDDTVAMRIGGRSSLLMRRFLVTCLMFAWIRDV